MSAYLDRLKILSEPGTGTGTGTGHEAGGGKAVTVPQSPPDIPATATVAAAAADGNASGFESPATRPQPKSSSSIRASIVRPVQLQDLVWASCAQIKGRNKFLCGRICSDSESATASGVSWPIPPEKVVVEFLSVPSNLHQMVAVPKSSVVFFNTPKNISGRNAFNGFQPDHPYTDKNGTEHQFPLEWDSGRLELMNQALREKYSPVARAQEVYKSICEKANEFLQQAIAAAAEASRATANDLILSQSSISSELSQPTPTFTQADIRSCALRIFDAPKIHVGDWIEYTSPGLQVVIQSRIVRIDKHSSTPLETEHKDFLAPDHLIRKIKVGSDGTPLSSSTDYACVKDHKMKDGRAVRTEVRPSFLH